MSKKSSTRPRDNKGQNTRRRSNPSKRESSRDPEVKKSEEQMDKARYNNSPDMYFGNEELLRQSFTFSFPQFIRPGKVLEGKFQQIPVDNVMSIFFNPSVGTSNSSSGVNTENMGVNTAARKMFVWLSANSGRTTQYQPNDITCAICALQSVIEISEFIRRAFGVIYLYNKRNWAYPREIIKAMGIDADDLEANIANYRSRFNFVINRVNSIAFPADIPVFRKSFEMYRHIYLDSESPMAQTYMFIPETWWEIDEVGTQVTPAWTQGTVVASQSTGLSTGNVSVLALINYLERMIQLLLNSTTLNYVYADVLRLAPNNLFTLPFLDEGYTVAPEYDPMMKLQINNMTIMGLPTATSPIVDPGAAPQTPVYRGTPENYILSLANGDVFYAPQFSSSDDYQNCFGTQIFLNFPHSMGDPDLVQRLEATRMVGWAYPSTWLDGTAHTYNQLPDHYVTQVKISGSHASDITLNNSFYAISDFTSAESALEKVLRISRFNDAPRLYRVTSDGSYTVLDMSGDLDYFTQIDKFLLERANDLAYLYMYTPSPADY